MTDHRLQAPAALRNRDPIRDVLRGVLPASGLVLEIASGSVAARGVFRAALSSPDLPAIRSGCRRTQSIPVWTHDAGVTNVLPPVMLDASSSEWPIATADAIICINMIHISPWHACEGLLRGAGKLLRPGAPLYLYGPYRRADVVTAPSNDAFDAALKSRDSEWGLRDLEAVAKLAASEGFSAPVITEMPANNLSVVFRHN